jgi:RNA polymerase sigma-70 factor (ECF subfamily)
MPSRVDPRNRRFTEEVLPHAAAAYNLARWLSRSDTDARDIVQEAFERALRYFDSYRGEAARTWLLSIVRNTANTWLSAKPKVAHLELVASRSGVEESADWERDAEADPVIEVSRQQDAEQLRRAIAHLPIDYREVLVLRELEDLSYRQIATIVGCPIGTVMSRLARARDQLGARLRPEGPGP